MEPWRTRSRKTVLDLSPWLTVETPSQVSVYQILKSRQVVFERAALKTLEEALGQ